VYGHVGYGSQAFQVCPQLSDKRSLVFEGLFEALYVLGWVVHDVLIAVLGYVLQAWSLRGLQHQ
jgi:hypothetical protein